MTAQNFSRPGAIDLSALRTPATATPQRAGAGAPAAGGSYSFDVGEDGFQAQVLEASLEHPVVLALWSSRAAQSREAVEALSRVADSYDGALTLARLDIDTSPELAKALQVRAVPFVLAVLKGQPVPLFEGSVDDAAAREAIDQVLQAAAANGITGRAAAVGAAVVEDPPDVIVDDVPPTDPRFVEAEQALERGDTEQAIASYRRLLEASPADAEAAARLAQAELVLRTTGVDPAAARAAGAERPGDEQAQLLAADVDLLAGLVDEAFNRLIEIVRRSAGEDRERIRRRLLDLFEVVGSDDSRVAAARRNLANALF